MLSWGQARPSNDIGRDYGPPIRNVGSVINRVTSKINDTKGKEEVIRNDIIQAVGACSFLDNYYVHPMKNKKIEVDAQLSGYPGIYVITVDFSLLAQLRRWIKTKLKWKLHWLQFRLEKNTHI